MQSAQSPSPQTTGGVAKQDPASHKEAGFFYGEFGIVTAPRAPTFKHLGNIMKTSLHVGCGHNRKNQTTKGFNTAGWTELRLDIDATAHRWRRGTSTWPTAVVLPRKF